MKKAFLFLISISLLFGFASTTAHAAPWDKLPEKEKKLYKYDFSCDSTTHFVRQGVTWPLASYKKNPRKVGPNRWKAIRSKPGSPLRLWYAYRIGPKGKVVVENGYVVIGTRRFIFLDYYMVRAIRSGKYNYQKNPRKILKLATGEFFCSRPLTR